MEPCTLAVHGDGTSGYTWNSSKVAQRVLLRPSSDRGICSVAGDAPLAPALYSEEPVVQCVTGANEAYICKHCYCKIVGKAKAREDCPRITFCSTECLASAADSLSFCGPILSELQKLRSAAEWENVLHILTMAVYYAYSVSAASTAADQTRALAMMQLEAQPQLPCVELNEPAQWLTTILREALSTEQLELLSVRGLCVQPHAGDEDSSIHRLLRIIKYNAQPLTIYGVPKVQLLALLPSVARINHSCRPNCALLYRINRQPPADSEEAVRCAVTVSVIPLRAVAPGEELTVSYLQPLCAPREMRRTLLQQGFAFNCLCERCQQGERAQIASTGRDPQLGAELQRVMMVVSRGQLQPPSVLQTLMGFTESALGINVGTQSGEVALSTAHDAAALVLEQTKVALKQLGPASARCVDYQWLAVRAQLALSVCWKGIGCASCVQRVEFAVQAAQSFVPIHLGRPSIPSSPSAEEAGATQGLRARVRSELQDALEVLRTVYLPACGDGGRDGTDLVAQVGTGKGALSAAEYVEKLHDLAVRFLEQLSK